MQLSTQQQMLVEQRLSNEKKSTLVAYLLWFFLSGFAAHRFYIVGTTGPTFGMLTAFWGGWVQLFVNADFVFLAIFGVWWVADAFLIPGMIRKDAASRRSRIMHEVSVTTPAEA